MNTIKTGMSLYVHVDQWKKQIPYLLEFIVRSVQETSFYASQRGSDFTRKFEKESMSHQSAITGAVFRAYFSEEEYENQYSPQQKKMLVARTNQA